MSILRGVVRSWFAERNFGYIRDILSGDDYFAHRTNFDFDPALIGPYLPVEFEVMNLVKNGKPMTKAINIRMRQIQTPSQILAEPRDYAQASAQQLSEAAKKNLSTDGNATKTPDARQGD
jgi:hypothetical protein